MRITLPESCRGGTVTTYIPLAESRPASQSDVTSLLLSAVFTWAGLLRILRQGAASKPGPAPSASRPQTPGLPDASWESPLCGSCDAMNSKAAPCVLDQMEMLCGPFDADGVFETSRDFSNEEL
ncbi:uncharacterized protein LOC110203668 [Phascolarctos cinereus]